MSFTSVDKRPIAEKIVEKLLDMLKQKQLMPGDKLPPERELATLLNVSRPSLREALRALSIMHIIDTRQGGGVFVSSLEPERLVEHLDFVLSLDNSTVLQLFEARRLLEVGIIDLAIERISDLDIKDLEKIIEKSIKAMDRPERFLQQDIDLHEKIADVSGNPMLSRMLASLSSLSRTGRMLTVGVEAMRRQTITDHKRIVEALKARDQEAARLAMTEHLNNSEQELREIISSDDTEDDYD